MDNDRISGQFVFEPVKAEAIPSALYNQHLKLISKSRMADFAGYLMPLWYSSISAEHKAVRRTAGLFDCTHMGVLEVAGSNAEGFLDTVSTNRVNNLKIGGAKYSYVLDAAGNVLDDIIIYRRANDRFMVVVNAANESKIKAYFRALLDGKAVVDADNPARGLEYIPGIRDMRDTISGPDCRVDIALQGPASTDILCSLAEGMELKEQIKSLGPFKVIEAEITGISCIVSHTGYTSAGTGFELFVHPEKVPILWEKLLEVGGEFGLLPCGLGARDSLRIEAGLPLYGHELAGEFGISPFEAGYGWVVKLDKEFFIGKAAMAEKAASFDMEVLRIELAGEKGVRPVRQNDGVLNNSGECVGWVLSCAKVADKQIALTYLSRGAVKEGDGIGVYYIARNQKQIEQGRKEKIEKEENLEADITGRVVSRFEKF